MLNITVNDGNYLWDSDNKALIKFGAINSEIVKETTQRRLKVSCAFLIPINEDILFDVLGFASNNDGGYILNNVEIKFNGKAQIGNSPYEIDGSPILYLSDIQNEFHKKGISLQIDEDMLFKVLKKRHFYSMIRKIIRWAKKI